MEAYFGILNFPSQRLSVSVLNLHVLHLQAEAARAEESARLHREFMGMLRQVLDGHMDSSTFEDTCRALLGTNSYVLFTLDKLIQKFIKHMAVSVKFLA